MVAQTGGPWYRKLRRSDRELSREDTLGFVDGNCVGVLSMAWPDGRPYAVPMNYGRSGDTIYMHCARAGLKLDVLRANPKAVLTVMAAGDVKQGDSACSATIAYQSAIAFGEVFEVEDEQEKLLGLKVLCRACGVDAPEDGTAAATAFAARARDTIVLALQLEHVTGKAKG